MIKLSYVHSREGLIRYLYNYADENCANRPIRLCLCDRALAKLKDENFRISNRQITRIITDETYKNRNSEDKAVAGIMRTILRVGRNMLNAERESFGGFSWRRPPSREGAHDVPMKDEKELPEIVQNFIEEHCFLTPKKIVDELRELYHQDISVDQVKRLLHDKEIQAAFSKKHEIQQDEEVDLAILEFIEERRENQPGIADERLIQDVYDRFNKKISSNYL